MFTAEEKKELEKVIRKDLSLGKKNKKVWEEAKEHSLKTGENLEKKYLELMIDNWEEKIDFYINRSLYSKYIPTLISFEKNKKVFYIVGVLSFLVTLFLLKNGFQNKIQYLLIVEFILFFTWWIIIFDFIFNYFIKDKVVKKIIFKKWKNNSVYTKDISKLTVSEWLTGRLKKEEDKK